MKTKSKYNLKYFIAYISNIITGREKNAFEKEMQKDPFMEEALEGLSMLSPSELEEDIFYLNKKIKAVTSNNKRFILYRVAAAVAILIFASSVFLTLFYTKPLVNQEEIAVIESPLLEKDRSVGLQLPSAAESPETSVKASGIRQEKKVSDKEKFIIPSKISEDNEIALADIPSAKTEELHVVAHEKKEESIAVARQITTAAPGAERIIFQDTGRILAKGVVTSSEDGLPVPGVNIFLKGTTTGVVTDLLGKFEFKLPEGKEATLVAAFVGMITQEIKVEKSADLEIVLEPSLLALEEVVVTGYGSRKKSATVGSVNTIVFEDLQSHPEFKPAAPVKGNREFSNYINKTVRFPENTKLTQAVVVLNFIVDINGRPKDISALRSPGQEFSSEAIRLLSEGPDWIPPSLGNEYIEIVSRIRIVLKK